MPRKKSADPFQLALNSWMLGAEAANVVWLRSMRMWGGGALAQREAQRMVSEKMQANATLPLALWPLVGKGASGEELVSQTLAHYSKPVRANRRRLTRKRK